MVSKISLFFFRISNQATRIFNLFILFFISLIFYIYWYMDEVISDIKYYFTHRPQLTKKNLFISGISIVVLGALLSYAYGISYSLSLNDHLRSIIGISMQVFAGVILVIDQITKNVNEGSIKDQIKSLTMTPSKTTLVLTLLMFAFGYFLWLCLSDFKNINWSVVFGFLVWLVIAYYLYLNILIAINKFLKQWIEQTSIVSNYEFKYAIQGNWILLGTSLLITFISGYFILHLPLQNTWVLLMLLVFGIISAFSVLPSFLLSLVYVVIFLFLKLLVFIKSRYWIRIVLWVLVFFIWIWGGILLVANSLGNHS